MIEDLIQPSVETFIRSKYGKFTNDEIYYQPTHGQLDLIESMALYLSNLLQLDLDPEGLTIGAGYNAVLENFVFCLTEANDGVLVPTPYYAAFKFDLVARASVNVIPVTTMTYSSGSSSKYYPTPAALDAALQRALKKNVEPKVLLLTHPQNPLGICYRNEIVQGCIDWCREHEIHLISDEIYAGSFYGNTRFTSVLQLASSLKVVLVHLFISSTPYPKISVYQKCVLEFPTPKIKKYAIR